MLIAIQIMNSYVESLLPDSNVVTILGIVTMLCAVAAFGINMPNSPINPVEYQNQGQALLPVIVLFSYLASDRVYGEMDEWQTASLLLPSGIALTMGYVDPVYSAVTDMQPLSGYVLIAMSIHAFYTLIIKD